ncbi:hypothetical protein MRB53_002613 [Persea americana]|uniref:Uncharacterized protein n=1 Tax=Persea americana TaxID=3435 RepID=A0ACC2MV91_PERAE|nr:hypothetical protein MRB53_002613 [Persea americana]
MFMKNFIVLAGAATCSRTITAKSALGALDNVKGHGLSRIILCSDALEVVKAIMGEPDWQIYPIVCEILVCGDGFDLFRAIPFPREFNSVAHWCANGEKAGFHFFVV